VAKDVKIQVEFNPAQVSQYRLIGYENRALKEDDFDNDSVDAGDMGAGHQVTAIYEIVPVGSKGWLPDRHFDGNKPAAAVAIGDDAVFVKLRYKLPDGKESRLIEKSVPMSAFRQAAAPSGDLAFAESVAAYGQILRHDTYMSGFTLADARQLAGHPDGYLRNEFVELTRMAEGAEPRN
jgi:Ca-activated chloride channel family protein